MRGSWASSVARFSSGVGQVVEVLVGCLVAVAVVAVFAQVVFRYALAVPLYWTEELARYLTVWLVLVGSALGFRSGTHFRFVFLTQGLPSRRQTVVEKLIDGISAAFLLVFVVATLPLLPVAADQTSPGLRISLLWLYLAMPVGAGLMLYFLVVGLLTGPHAPLPLELAEREKLAALDGG